MKYRPEIDGLRAVAVVPVILYHAGLPPFSGGFIGVDVFFVISGYLITNLLHGELEAGSFSIVRFYERRIRRILPALFVVCAVCVPIAWLWMLPGEFRQFAISLTAVALFYSNVVFWMQSGYFDTAASFKPLLHTWSLAIEEQFYLLFPIFLAVMHRFGRRTLVVSIAIASLASLALSQWATTAASTANFYLLPFRAWELGAGAILALIGDIPLSRGVREFGGLAGLAMVLGAALWFDESVPVPSVFGLIPVLGTTAVICLATPQTVAGKALAWRPIVGIGLISYSAYLWHQPLFAFARIQSPDGIAPTQYLALSLLAILLGYLSWRFVEQPVRDRQMVSRRHLFIAAALGTSVLIAFGASGTARLIRPASWADQDVRAMSSYPRTLYRDGICFLRVDQNSADFGRQCFAPANSMLVWGDSHAAALTGGFAGQPGGVGQLTSSSCPPALGFGGLGVPNCRSVNEQILARLKGYRGLVVLHANWSAYMTSAPEPFLRHLAMTIARLREEHARFLVVLSVPQWKPNAPAAWLRERASLKTRDGLVFAHNSTAGDIRKIDAAIIRFLAGAPFAAPMDSFCPAPDLNLCAIGYDSGRLPTLFAWDTAHLTKPGAVFVGQRILKMIRAAGAH